MVGAEHAPNLVAWLAGQGIARKTLAPAIPTPRSATRTRTSYLRIDDDFGEHWRDRHAGAGRDRARLHAPGRRDPGQARARTRWTLYRQQAGALRLLARGINPGVAAPLAVVAHATWRRRKRARALALTILPYLLLLSAFLGGAHLVIDTTAGERERQSLEPLLATPASRGAIVSGKIAAAGAAQPGRAGADAAGAQARRAVRAGHRPDDGRRLRRDREDAADPAADGVHRHRRC